jgi:hypothetical protein
MNSKARILAEDNDLRMAWKPHLRQPCVNPLHQPEAPARASLALRAGVLPNCTLIKNLFAPDLCSRDNDHSCA